MDYEIGSGDRSTPQSVLEGGSASADELIEAIVRRIGDLAASAVLEVISWVPDIELDLAAWCEKAGYELLRVLADEHVTTFHITTHRSNEEGREEK